MRDVSILQYIWHWESWMHFYVVSQLWWIVYQPEIAFWGCCFKAKLLNFECSVDMNSDAFFPLTTLHDICTCLCIEYEHERFRGGFFFYLGSYLDLALTSNIKIEYFEFNICYQTDPHCVINGNEHFNTNLLAFAFKMLPHLYQT